VAKQIIAYANADNSEVKWAGERPMGPGKYKGEKFVYPMVGSWKPIVISSIDDYLPEAPPAHDSDKMAGELEELREIERTVPASITAWSQHSTYQAIQWWYEQIATSVFEHRLHNEPLKTAHAYATIAVANSDAIIACFRAKYTWWQIRPAQLDPSLSTLFPSPPHPSYPSAHSCNGGSMAGAITHYFPERAVELSDAAHAGGYSRLIAGIHYPSDHKAGSQLGKAVAASVVEFADQLVE